MLGAAARDKLYSEAEAEAALRRYAAANNLAASADAAEMALDKLLISALYNKSEQPGAPWLITGAMVSDAAGLVWPFPCEVSFLCWRAHSVRLLLCSRGRHRADGRGAAAAAGQAADLEPSHPQDPACEAGDAVDALLDVPVLLQCMAD